MQRISSFAEQNPSMRVIVFIIGLSQEKETSSLVKANGLSAQNAHLLPSRYIIADGAFTFPTGYLMRKKRGLALLSLPQTLPMHCLSVL